MADENPHILIGALDAVCRRWVDHPDVIARAERKLFQLDTARQLGVAVPRTLMTNDPDAANDWAASCPLIVKPLSPGFGLAPPTSVVSEQDLGLLTSNPSLLQERVDATADIRLVVIGGHVTAWSRPRSHDVVDWRTVDPNGNDFSLIESRFIRDPAIALNASLGLTMAVQDWLMTTDGSVFLEANPQGAWLFLEEADDRIPPVLADHLVSEWVSTTVDGEWPPPWKRMLFDFYTKNAAPDDDGTVAPTIVQPSRRQAPLDDLALDVARRANDAARERVSKAEEKGSRHLRLSLTLVALAVGVIAFSIGLASDSALAVGPMALGAIALSFLTTSAFQSAQVDRVGFAEVPQVDDLGRDPMSRQLKATLTEERGAALSNWTATHKLTELMQAKAWFTRGLVSLVIAAIMSLLVALYAEAETPVEAPASRDHIHVLE